MACAHEEVLVVEVPALCGSEIKEAFWNRRRQRRRTGRLGGVPDGSGGCGVARVERRVLSIARTRARALGTVFTCDFNRAAGQTWHTDQEGEGEVGQGSASVAGASEYEQLQIRATVQVGYVGGLGIMDSIVIADVGTSLGCASTLEALRSRHWLGFDRQTGASSRERERFVECPVCWWSDWEQTGGACVR